MPRARSRRRPAATPAPRDRKDEFEPRLIEKHQTRFTGFDEKVRSLYARGMTTREIQGQLEERVRHRGQSVADQRHEGRVENRAVFVALGITLEGQKEVLGLWTGAGKRVALLVGGVDRAAQSRCERYRRGLCGWAARLSASDRNDLSEGAGAALHRASDPQQSARCDVRPSTRPSASSGASGGSI